jgi:hypothetical protein
VVAVLEQLEGLKKLDPPEELCQTVSKLSVRSTLPHSQDLVGDAMLWVVMTHIQVLGPLRRSKSVRHIDGAFVVNVEGDVRPLIGDYHAVVVRGRGLVVDGEGGRTFDQYTQVVGQLSQPYKYAGAASAAMYSASVLERDCCLTRGRPVDRTTVDGD